MYELCYSSRRPALTVLSHLLVYANEQYVGAAIRESGLPRQDVWITTKYNGGDMLEAVHTSLRKVRLSAVQSTHIYLSLPTLS